MAVKFGMEEWTKFHRDRCNVSSLLGEEPQNSPGVTYIYRRFALRAMLPVIKKITATPLKLLKQVLL